MRIHRIRSPYPLPPRLGRTVVVRFHGETSAELSCVPDNVPVGEIARFLGEKAGKPVLGWSPVAGRDEPVSVAPAE